MPGRPVFTCAKKINSRFGILIILPSHKTHWFCVFVKHHYRGNSFLGEASSICSIFPLCMVSNTLEKSTNKYCLEFYYMCFFSDLPNRICEVVDWFFWKPSWFFQRNFSTSVQIKLKSRALLTLAATTRWNKFKSWTRLIAFHIALIPLGKVWI